MQFQDKKINLFKVFSNHKITSKANKDQSYLFLNNIYNHIFNFKIFNIFYDKEKVRPLVHIESQFRGLRLRLIYKNIIKYKLYTDVAKDI